MINICSWNCRGAGSHTFPRLIKEIRRSYVVHVLIIIEPRVSGSRANNIVSKLGFNKCHRIEAEGFSEGIWILLDDNFIEIEIISTTGQVLHSHLTIRNGGVNFFLSCV